MNYNKTISDQKLSKYISYLLRHEPESAGIELDKYGWTNVKKLIAAVNKKYPLNFETLERIVNSGDKKRYSFNENKTKIKANHGHSVNIKLDLPEQKPPEFLYHGSAKRFEFAINQNGLISKNRIHVHLSVNEENALKVGARHGEPILYKVLSEKMYDDGYKFYHSASDIWLTESVPAKYLQRIFYYK